MSKSNGEIHKPNDYGTTFDPDAYFQHYFGKYVIFNVIICRNKVSLHQNIKIS